MKQMMVPGSVAELLALWARKIPLPVVDTLFPLVKARSLMAADRLGVFEALRAEPLRAGALAGRLGLDADSLRLLLRVLAASGYLRERGDRFALSPLARRTAIRGAPRESLGFLRFNYRQWTFLEHLEELLRTGKGLDVHARMDDLRDWENYQRAMLELARAHAPILARHVPVPRGATLLLDVAGSHGLLGAAVCRRHPPMRSRAGPRGAARLTFTVRQSGGLAVGFRPRVLVPRPRGAGGMSGSARNWSGTAVAAPVLRALDLGHAGGGRT